MSQPIQTSSLLVGELQRLQLLSAEQLRTLESSGFTARHADGRAGARELLKRGWLTPFQVNQLLQGKGHELILGSYLLLERLGDGGAGQVFKARHLAMQRIIALKILHKELLDDQETLDRFRREVRLISDLHHPNVVQAHDAVMTADAYYMAMEFVEGTDLGQLVKQRGPLPVAQACEYLRQAALGLQYIHERGLVHRDIKPSNLLVSGKPAPTAPPWGNLKILDLGLARPQRATDPDGGITKTSSFTIGTVDYMSPEQANDFRGVDIRSDIYSLGCTAYVLLAGRPPFEGTMAQKLVKHQQGEPPALEKLRGDVPAAVAQVIRRMLAKQPQARFQQPGEIAMQFTGVSLPEGSAVATVVGARVPTPLQVDIGGDSEMVQFKSAASPRKTVTAMAGDTAGKLATAAAGSARALLQRFGHWVVQSPQRMLGTAGAFLLAFLILYLSFGTRAPSGPTTTFLAQLPEERLRAYKFDKQGRTPDDKRLVVNNQPVEKGLLLVPARDGVPASVSYRLLGKYRTFTTSAALDDASQGDYDVTFSVIGDGRSLWSFNRIAGGNVSAKSCSLDVSDVQVLELVVNVRGDYKGNPGFLPVWVDPQLQE